MIMAKEQGVISGREPMLGSRVRSFLPGVRNLLGDNGQSICFALRRKRGEGCGGMFEAIPSTGLLLIAKHCAKHSFVIC